MKEQEDLTNKDNITSIHVDGMYENWFLDYASYVILERAVPTLLDGLKPVHRRTLHAMKVMDDGRFHKVANIIGQTMAYHPHGDAAIGDALVNLGQKDLLIDTQGNWGDVRTGDSAAASRYIEARLSKFALETLFNPSLTDWQPSYDGRKNEPVLLPVKFPLVLAMGTEGIAVGLATKILPHNFCELCIASMDLLKGKKIKLYPDFPTGGMIDVSDYKKGMRGGKVKVRAHIVSPDKKTLLIKDIPYGTTTSSIIDSILKANDKGKIRIKHVVDNTAKDVEIAIELQSGVSPDVAIDALYAFTNCEASISPNSAVIYNDKPVFRNVEDILAISTEYTKELLRLELEINKKELDEKWHFASLEKIFIENRIYRKIEECETWEAVIEAIRKGLKPHTKKLIRKVTDEDIVRLTEIKIKRISKFDSFKADELIKKIEDERALIIHNLKNLTEYAISYFQNLLDKYGKGRERKTEIRNFDTIQVQQVVASNQKLYINRKEGFIGFGLKKDEFIEDCSDIDDVIVFRKDGKMIVSRIDEKKFVGKDILHAQVWRKGDERTIYHLIYLDADNKKNYVKRFAVKAITREKEYDLTNSKGNSQVVYLSVQPNSEEEIVKVHLRSSSRAKNKVFEFSFGELAIKGRKSKGNIITKYPISKVEQTSIGPATLGGIDIWLDEATGRLNKDERGNFLGNFQTDEQILVIFKNGSYELTNFEFTNRYEIQEIEHICKLNPEHVLSAIYEDGKSKKIFVKRFLIEAKVEGKKYPFISEHRNSKLLVFSIHPEPEIEFNIIKGKEKEKINEIIKINEFIDVKGWKALGNRLSQNKITGKIKLFENPELTKTETPSNKKVEESEETESSNKDKKSSKSLEIGSVIEFDVDQKKPESPKPKKKPAPKKKGKKKDDDKNQGDLFS